MNVYAHSTRKAKRESARLLDKVAGNDIKKVPYFPYNYLIRAKIRENTYHFTNEQAGIPVKLGKSARYFCKSEVIFVFLNIGILLICIAGTHFRMLLSKNLPLH